MRREAQRGLLMFLIQTGNWQIDLTLEGSINSRKLVPCCPFWEGVLSGMFYFWTGGSRVFFIAVLIFHIWLSLNQDLMWVSTLGGKKKKKRVITYRWPPVTVLLRGSLVSGRMDILWELWMSSTFSKLKITRDLIAQMPKKAVWIQQRLILTFLGFSFSVKLFPSFTYSMTPFMTSLYKL